MALTLKPRFPLVFPLCQSEPAAEPAAVPEPAAPADATTDAGDVRSRDKRQKTRAPRG